MRLRNHWRRCSQDMPVSGSTPHRNSRRTQRLTQCTTWISSSARTSRRLTRAIEELPKPRTRCYLRAMVPCARTRVSIGWPRWKLFPPQYCFPRFYCAESCDKCPFLDLLCAGMNPEGFPPGVRKVRGCSTRSHRNNRLHGRIESPSVRFEGMPYEFRHLSSACPFAREVDPGQSCCRLN